jgi:hypothetical protein
MGVNLTIPYRLINLADIPAYDVRVSPPSSTGGDVENRTPLEFEGVKGESSDIIYSFTPMEAGNMTIGELSATIIIAGRRQKVTAPPISGIIYRGLEVVIHAPASVGENEAFELSIRIRSDAPDRVKDIHISYSIPPQLDILSKPEGMNGGVFQLQNGNLTLKFQLISNKPYRKAVIIPFPTITYEAFDETLNYTKVFSMEVKDIEIRVQENLFLRYGVESLIVVLGIILTTIYIRRKMP